MIQNLIRPSMHAARSFLYLTVCLVVSLTSPVLSQAELFDHDGAVCPVDSHTWERIDELTAQLQSRVTLFLELTARHSAPQVRLSALRQAGAEISALEEHITTIRSCPPRSAQSLHGPLVYRRKLTASEALPACAARAVEFLAQFFRWRDLSLLVGKRGDRPEEHGDREFQADGKIAMNATLQLAQDIACEAEMLAGTSAAGSTEAKGLLLGLPDVSRDPSQEHEVAVSIASQYKHLARQLVHRLDNSEGSRLVSDHLLRLHNEIQALPPILRAEIARLCDLPPRDFGSDTVDMRDLRMLARRVPTNTVMIKQVKETKRPALYRTQQARRRALAALKAIPRKR